MGLFGKTIEERNGKFYCPYCGNDIEEWLEAGIKEYNRTAKLCSVPLKDYDKIREEVLYSKGYKCMCGKESKPIKK